MDREPRLESIIEGMRARKCRITPQRLAIVRAFLQLGEEQSSIEQLYAAVARDYPTTSLATIYKTVGLLKEMGEVLELHGLDDASHYDVIRLDPHVHVVCRICGRIVDVDLQDLDRVMAEVRASAGFQSVESVIQFSGICRDCAMTRSDDTSQEMEDEHVG